MSESYRVNSPDERRLQLVGLEIVVDRTSDKPCEAYHTANVSFVGGGAYCVVGLDSEELRQFAYMLLDFADVISSEDVEPC